MKEIYVSTTKGLFQNKEALRILRNSNVVSGIEMSDIDNKVKIVKDAGLKVSLHTPRRNLTTNLAAPNYMAVFEDNQGPRLLEVIRNSDAATVGFHCGYSAEKVYKMNAYPNVPHPSTLFANRDDLLKRISNNTLALERKINQDLTSNKQKQVVLETLDYSRENAIPWEVQLDEAKANKKEIEEIVSKYGINAGIEHVTEPSFIRDVLDNVSSQNIKPFGFLFDIAHVFISADAKIHKKEFTGTIEDYFDEMINASNGRTYQISLTVPEGNQEKGYADRHNMFVPGEILSDYITELGRKIIRKSPEISVVTLEMRSNLGPVKYAEEIVKQAEYVSRELFY